MRKWDSKNRERKLDQAEREEHYNKIKTKMVKLEKLSGKRRRKKKEKEEAEHTQKHIAV